MGAETRYVIKCSYVQSIIIKREGGGGGLRSVGVVGGRRIQDPKDITIKLKKQGKKVLYGMGR